MIWNNTARPASCTHVRMLPAMLYVHVTGLWIPRGRRSAIQSTFYIYAYPKCLLHKLLFSNLWVLLLKLTFQLTVFSIGLILKFLAKETYHYFFPQATTCKLENNNFVFWDEGLWFHPWVSNVGVRLPLNASPTPSFHSLPLSGVFSWFCRDIFFYFQSNLLFSTFWV